MPNGSFGAPPTGADFGRVAGNTSFATPIGFQVLVAEMPRQTNRIEVQDADPGALEGARETRGRARATYVPWDAVRASRSRRIGTTLMVKPMVRLTSGSAKPF